MNYKSSKFKIRKYQSFDCEGIASLFYQTVHTVNIRDYSQEQVDAWATCQIDLAAWDRSLQEHFSLVAVADGNLLGFGDIDQEGYLDRLYVHADYQRQGIATALCDQLEKAVRGKIFTQASITARPFFEQRGYVVVRKQQVRRNNIFLTNYLMEKQFNNNI